MNWLYLEKELINMLKLFLAAVIQKYVSHKLYYVPAPTYLGVKTIAG